MRTGQYSCDVIDAVYDTVGDRVYAGVTSDVPVNGNSIAVINDNTGVVEDYIPVPSDPKRLALSADGSRLYVIFADAELLVAIDTTSRTVIQTWQMGVITAQAGYNEIEAPKDSADGSVTNGIGRRCRPGVRRGEHT